MIKNKLVLIILGLFLLTVVSIHSRGNRDNDEKLSVLQGSIFLTGNEPHTQVLLKTEEGELYELTGSAVDEISGNGPGARFRLKGVLLDEKESNSFKKPRFEVHSWKEL